MEADRASIRRLLERETQAWRGLPPAEYDHALREMIDEVGAAPRSAESVEAILALVSATLRRKSETLTESRVRCAEHLLALGSVVSEPATHLRIRLLLLLAWLQLAAVVEGAPESISIAPDLPAGAVFPAGVDPAEIADPVLRERAQEAVERHTAAAERWNAKQRALGHLHRLATSVRATLPGWGNDADATKELAVAMSLAPGLPPTLRQLLEEDAGSLPAF